MGAETVVCPKTPSTLRQSLLLPPQRLISRPSSSRKALWIMLAWAPMCLKTLPLHAEQYALTTVLFLQVFCGEMSHLSSLCYVVSLYQPGTRSPGLKLSCPCSNTYHGSTLPQTSAGRHFRDGGPVAALPLYSLVPLGRALTKFLAATTRPSLSLTSCSR